MVLVDANLLIYAVNSTAPRHAPARRWLEKTLSGSTPVGLAWIVLLAFLRVTTRPGILGQPLSPDEAMAYVDSWLDQPCVEIVAAGPRHWQLFRHLTLAVGTAGNLTSDAYLAALALEHGAEIYSADEDFRRFAGVVHINPLSPVE
jgi:toxin-antitoxin system PIN domain toxin